jgi:hypothetical protein
VDVASVDFACFLQGRVSLHILHIFLEESFLKR